MTDIDAEFYIFCSLETVLSTKDKVKKKEYLLPLPYLLGQMETTQAIFSPRWQNPSMKTINYPKETLPTSQNKLGLSTLPGTQLCTHSHKCGNFQGHSSLNLKQMCPILHARLITILLQRQCKNNPTSKHLQLNIRNLKKKPKWSAQEAHSMLLKIKSNIISSTTELSRFI